ncbi:hypothetical protein A9179_06230 [Pseudomonas alcaligenes]|uniref:UrcA family protein n=1 Tax=Aquipseudomonas alcaligenes TaxID=43263 RepID=A0ABR7RZ92_AQUAC|nr:hypothetical protein [Pseudomonas alcaligenes]MBC9249870.1 hypothetical protein [Pseudomonas alcaligenes]
MKLLLAGLLPALLGGGVAVSLPPPEQPLRSAYLVSSQRLPCLYARLAAARGEDRQARLEDCANAWNDRQAAQLLARSAAEPGTPPSRP